MRKFDVLTIGNAIVDIIARCFDDFLIKNGIIKGAMELVDNTRAELLYSRMQERIEVSGGSAANTAASIASLGGSAAFIGKVANDHLGQIFAHDMRGQGVSYDTRPLENAAPTARCMIFNTPDGERSMNTYLGACVEFGPEDIDVSKVAAAKIIYFEGYLWDPPRAKEAMRFAARIAHENNNEVALTLSDAFCVERYRDEFLDMICSGMVDIVFANEAEILALYNTSSLESAISAMGKDCKHIACITRGDKGSVIIKRDEIITIAALAVNNLIDTTGAGDLYAAGFLYGYTNGFSLEDAARLGSLTASLVIQQVGARLSYSLRDVAIKEGFIKK